MRGPVAVLCGEGQDWRNEEHGQREEAEGQASRQRVRRARGTATKSVVLYRVFLLVAKDACGGAAAAGAPLRPGQR